MPKYICPQCDSELSHNYMAGPYYFPDGEGIYCSVCQYTAPEATFKRATYGYKEQERQEELRTQVAEDKLYDDTLE